MQKNMSIKRFVEWEEQFVSHDRGSRIVHYYLKDRHGNAILAVIGTERSLRHMVYVVSDDFLHLPGLAKPSNSSFKWRSRREVVDWLTSLLSKPRSSMTHFGDHTTKYPRHDSSRTSDTDVSTGEDVEEHSSYVNHKGNFSRKIKATSKGISWLGSSWTCRKRLKHYESFRRSGITISVNDYVYVMAEEENHHIACLEDMYEDKKAQKKVRVRWFHRTNEVVGSIPPPPAHAAEVFITPFRQVLSVECVDGLATILTPEHYDECSKKLSSDVMAQIHVCSRQFNNEGIRSFSLSEMQGYWHQKTLESIDLALPRGSSKHDLTKDSLDMDEEEDPDIEATIKKCPRKNRCSRRRTGASERFCVGDAVEKGRLASENVYRLTGCGGADRDYNLSERKLFLTGSGEGRRHGGAQEQESFSFDIGDSIELLCQDSGIRGCWFRCTIIKKAPHRFKVWYKDVLNEDGSNNLEEWVPSFRIAAPDKLGMRIAGRPTVRPCPPENGSSSSFEVGTVVDAWWNDGWWEGLVVLTKEPLGEVQIYFPGENVSSTFQKSDLRLSRDWVNNQWVDVKQNAELAATLLLIDSKQGPDRVFLHSSNFSNDCSAHVARVEVGDHVNSSDSEKKVSHIFSQVAVKESLKENSKNAKYNTVGEYWKEGEIVEVAGGGYDDLVSLPKGKNVSLQENFRMNADAFRYFPSIMDDSVEILSDQMKPLLNGANLEGNGGEICNSMNDKLYNDLRRKSSRKREHGGESVLLSRSGTSCGKEETEELTDGKLMDTEHMRNDRESLLTSNSDDLAKRHEDLAEAKKLKQGHENLKPIHGPPPMSGSLFMGSMPIANLVMSR